MPRGRSRARGSCPSGGTRCWAALLGTTVGLVMSAGLVQEMRERWRSQVLDSGAAPMGPESGAETRARPREPEPMVYCLLAPHQGGDGDLEEVRRVLARLGFTRGGPQSRWSLLWAHGYPPFSRLLHWGPPSILPRWINHFPGSGFLTSKLHVASTNLTFIPRAFHLPEDTLLLMAQAKEQPKKLWLQKSKSHRGIQIVSPHDVERLGADVFVQEFVQRPLLIDGRKFDVGIYVVVTSVQPLRVYAYDEEVLLRFCSKNYLPFDPRDVLSYVVGDDYTPTWEMPSLKRAYVDHKYSHKQTLAAHLRSLGMAPERLWDDIKKAIADLLLVKEPQLNASLQGHASHWKFFELVRFDFLLDEDLNIHLMEVNMSPNLSSRHFPPNRLLYEQVLFSTLQLVGVASSVIQGDTHSLAMQVSDRDIQTHPELCLHHCRDSCEHKCQLCESCLSAAWRSALKDAHLEHTRRWSARRVVPPATDQRGWDPLQEARLSEHNQLMAWWFKGKCLQDITWCF
ncbi:probable tubulin polyglutamylase ttll-15 isoform X1 [Lethenteron reissneri]|uniref:probable tubulin polyglutamylase ttll-15 isoform X1 n=1 Tax=Lethenteron reissneri TaxID=7753 RepID=UPI002AB6B937|nr:probable tubulin polyglutamylase ttll-15 isoform X1 [Lethenteron reissneri]